MSAPDVVAPTAIHWEVRGAAQPTALSPASSPPPWPTSVRPVGMTPPVPVIEAGAGVIGADERDDHVATVATLLVLKGSTRTVGQASCTCEGCALCAVPSTLAGADPTSRDPVASAAAAIPATPSAARVAVRGVVISSSTRIGRWRPQPPGRCPRRRATE